MDFDNTIWLHCFPTPFNIFSLRLYFFSFSRFYVCIAALVEFVKRHLEWRNYFFNFYEFLNSINSEVALAKNSTKLFKIIVLHTIAFFFLILEFFPENAIRSRSVCAAATELAFSSDLFSFILDTFLL
jgi:hypothetical protein